jgi:DNA-binding SARP family transcriptional activator
VNRLGFVDGLRSRTERPQVQVDGGVPAACATDPAAERARLDELLNSLKDKAIIWVAGGSASGSTKLVASYLAQRHVADTWYVGARLAVAVLPALIDGLSAPEVLIIDGCEELGDDSPVHRLVIQGVRTIPAASHIVLVGREEPPALYGPVIASGSMAVVSEKALQEALEDAASGAGARDTLQPTASPSGTRAASPLFRVHVLGRFRMFRAGVPLSRERRAQPKPIELLQALIAFGGTDVGAGKVIDALWPDADGDAGHHALETTLYRLRKLLDSPDAVQMTQNTLSLDRSQFWVDMWELERTLQTSGGAESALAARLAEAHRMYEGHFLEQNTEKSWALDVRQALRDNFLRRMRQLARAYEGRRLWEEASGVYSRALELDATAEDLYRGLMVCQRELGQHSEVLRTYSRCRELLARSLGVMPDPKTQAIYASVRQKSASPNVALRPKSALAKAALPSLQCA